MLQSSEVSSSPWPSLVPRGSCRDLSSFPRIPPKPPPLSRPFPLPPASLPREEKRRDVLKTFHLACLATLDGDSPSIIANPARHSLPLKVLGPPRDIPSLSGKRHTTAIVRCMGGGP